MSATKRSRQRPAESPPTRSELQPATKRIKSSHVPVHSGFDFLVDEEARAGRKIEAKLTNGVSRSQSSRVDQSHAIVARSSDEGDSESEDEQEQNELGAEVIAISSGDEESSELDEDELEEDEHKNAEDRAQSPAIENDSQHGKRPLTNGHISMDENPEEETQAVAGAGDAEMEDADQVTHDESEPTFGDLLRFRHSEAIDLQKDLQNVEADQQGVVAKSGQSRISNGHTLGVTLSQALKTNDKDMLERCLAHNEPNTIRSTIQRQSSREISKLLERIAERVHRRPGRAGNLMTWVQWSLVCHGGYIAHQPELMKKLRSLAQVLRQRANGLQPLLHLKGKLDLLTAQLELRRARQLESQAVNMKNVDDEEGVLYIEGQDEDWSSDNEEVTNEDISHTQVSSRREGKMKVTSTHETAEDEDAPNGVSHGDDDESSAGEDDDDDEEPNGILDLEAEEGSEDEDEESLNDVLESEASSEEDDSSDEEVSEAENVKQAKPSMLNRKR